MCIPLLTRQRPFVRPFGLIYEGMDSSIYFRVLMHCHFKKRRLIIDIAEAQRLGDPTDDLEMALACISSTMRCFAEGRICHDSGRTRLVELPEDFLSVHRAHVADPMAWVPPMTGHAHRMPELKAGRGQTAAASSSAR